MQKGKISASIAVEQCAISTKRNSLRIDIDEEFVYHLKVSYNFSRFIFLRHLLIIFINEELTFHSFDMPCIVTEIKLLQIINSYSSKID